MLGSRECFEGLAALGDGAVRGWWSKLAGGNAFGRDEAWRRLHRWRWWSDGGDTVNRGWQGGALKGAATELLAAIDELLGGDDNLRHHVVGDGAVVLDFAGDDIFGNEIDGWYLIPRSGDGLVDGERFVTRFDETDFSRAVIDKAGGTGSGANGLVIDVNHGAGRITTHQEPAAHAAGGEYNHAYEQA